MRRGTDLGGPHAGPHRQAGFTIIEVLVSITLLSIIILVILTPLTGLFGLTQRSDQQVTATQAAQRTLESIRGDWLSAERYGKLCLTKALPTMTPPLQVQLEDLDQTGKVMGTSTLRSQCDGAADSPPMRRVRVSVQVGKASSTLSVDVARP
ncbi:prepilin-type N-terminal cleavage/methylation domain-containing protein [Deinococcus sp. Arct2-2]|uniref:type IV pilus modification PilV family protein n=1 Tax=Deinococcus sp. Arct2-2 TaxID=2568653 RepID=UPI0010A54E0D|nr:prepilin-type N-terminal cleavage/methylation domain-containing protein [Deinococcus sp. Arct2-2]THF68124.1 prepilin-type N-terminal cleavage/methylation domain-containing protein [Deinococcus sp. Arct2-2]